MTRPQVIVYELNEVPWSIIDRYVKERPDSALAAALPGARCLTTHEEDTDNLLPWRTWPTFHKSMHTPEHNSYELGQDPATFCGENIWDVAEEAGLRVGLFGPLQSWPARAFKHGGFFVPDTFSRTPETDPPRLRPYQAFNLLMTQRNTSMASTPLSYSELCRAATTVVGQGLTGWSTRHLVRHLIDEQRDERYKARRPVVQALTGFDLYWKLHLQTEPDLSIFFTNHVATMMHRFWSDWIPNGNGTSPTATDPVYQRFVPTAMDYFDHQFRKILKHIEKQEDAVLIVSSSMGQAAVAHEEESNSYFVRDTSRLANAFGFSDAHPGHAMYPRTSFEFETAADVDRAQVALASVTTDDGNALFRDFRPAGRTLSFEVPDSCSGEQNGVPVSYQTIDGNEMTGALSDLGVEVRARLGGKNTAWHTPEGALLAIGKNLRSDRSRQEIDILDAAPSILRMLDVEPGPSMRGSPTALVG